MILQNSTNKMRIYTMSHDEVCRDKCYCTVTEQPETTLDRKTGVRSLRMLPVRLPLSVYVPARGLTADLPEDFRGSKKLSEDIVNKLLVVKGN